MYTSSYKLVSTYIPGTENKTEHRPDARHHGQEGEKKNMAKSEGGPF